MAFWFWLIGFALGANAQTPQPSGTIQDQVQHAKRDGKKVINVRMETGTYPDISYEESAKTLKVANSAQILVTQKVVLNLGLGLRTFYKARVIAWLNRKYIVKEAGKNKKTPDTLLPLAEDEIIFSLPGGILKIDDIEVRNLDAEYPQIPLGQECLVFFLKGAPDDLNPLLDSLGVFFIEKGELIVPAVEQSNAMATRLKTDFQDSLNSFKRSFQIDK